MLERQREGVAGEGIAKQLGVGVASVYRVLKAARVAA
jgi:transposase